MSACAIARLAIATRGEATLPCMGAMRNYALDGKEPHLTIGGWKSS